MEKSIYTILMVFLLSVLILVGFLGWHPNGDDGAVANEIAIKTETQPILEENVNDVEPKADPSYHDVVSEGTLAIEKSDSTVEPELETEYTKDDENNQTESDPQDIEEIMELGFSGEEAQNILDNEKEMKDNPNLIMNLEINPELIEEMKSIGYSQEEAIRLLNKHMHNPDEMERIMEKLR